MELLVAFVGYCLVSSAVVPAAGYAAPSFGMQPREAMWAAFQAVVFAPALLGIIVLAFVAFG